MPTPSPTSFVERLLIPVLAASLALFLALGSLAANVMSEAGKVSQRIHRSDAILLEVSGLLTTLHDADAAVTTYVLSAEDDALEPYRNVRANFAARVDRLRLLTRDARVQFNRVDVIEALLRARCDALDAVVAARAEDGLGPARLALTAAPARAQAEHIRLVLDDLRRAEDERATVARGEETRLVRNVVVAAAAVLALLSAAAVTGLVTLRREFRKRRVFEQGLVENATRDGLTGVANRREFERLLQLEWERTLQFEAPLSVVMLDVDHFKRINDTWGHPCGDAVLRELTARIEKRLRSADTLARYGGEEFAVLLPQTGAVAAFRFADNLRRLVTHEPMVFEGYSPISVTVSMGVAESIGLPGAAQLVVAADRALYRAKSTGRNQVVQATLELDGPKTAAAAALPPARTPMLR